MLWPVALVGRAGSQDVSVFCTHTRVQVDTCPRGMKLFKHEDLAIVTKNFFDLDSDFAMGRYW